MPRPGRNDPCPCDSGKKFKQCCASKRDRLSPALIAVLIAGAVLVVIVIISNARRSSDTWMVWSPEHGHYHDASGREVHASPDYLIYGANERERVSHERSAPA